VKQKKYVTGRGRERNGGNEERRKLERRIGCGGDR
jgi:hypothetical protein